MILGNYLFSYTGFPPWGNPWGKVPPPTFPPEEKWGGGYENTWGKPYGKPWVNTQGFPLRKPLRKSRGKTLGTWRAPLGKPLGKTMGKAPPLYSPLGKPLRKSGGGGIPRIFTGFSPGGKPWGGVGNQEFWFLQRFAKEFQWEPSRPSGDPPR